ncbi:MAG: hypothetical protein V5A18_10095, partial [Haloarculaceae archaeon]
QAESILQALPPETTETGEGEATESGEAEPSDEEEAADEAEEETAEAEDLDGPPREEIEEGATFVDVGGTEPVKVEVVEAPGDRTVRVEKTDPQAPGGSFETTALIQNLRRPGEVEGTIAGSTFPVANVQDTGRAVLSDEWQIIPEHATIPEAAEVRHDLGTADLPVARLPGTEGEGESLSQMGRRSQSRQEQTIQEEVESVEQELQQAKQELKDLKAKRPEQQESQGEQGGLFGAGEQSRQQSGQQQALGGEFEASDETTQRLQAMIDEKKAYIQRLQDKLVDLRRQAPDAQSEARDAQRDISDATEESESAQEKADQAERAGDNATAPKQMANMQAIPEGEFSDPQARELRADLIEEDLFKVIRDQWRQPAVEDRMNAIATTIDRIRELRAAVERDMVGPQGVERDVANMRDMIDEELSRILPSLEQAERTALQNRIRAWTGQTGVPGDPALHHLNRVGGTEAFPRYATEDGYEVRMDDAGMIEVISPNTGNPIDGRSSRYVETLIEYFAENSEAIDQIPRVTDTNPDIGMGQWAGAVASDSQNPFEIVEAVVTEGKEASLDPVETLLEERAPFSLESVSPYVAGDEIFEQGLQNWVEEGGSDLNNVARDAQRNDGITVTTQELVDNYLRENPGGAAGMARNESLDPLLQQFRNVTGIDADFEFIRSLYEEVYDTSTTQNQGDAGTDAPFSPTAPYVRRPTEQRSNTYAWDGVRYRRDPDGRSLRERAEEGYEVRDGAGDEARDLGLRVMQQMSLFGPPEGETQTETTARESGVGQLETTDDPSDLTRPTEEELQRIEDGLLGRGITDDLAENHSASLVGRTIAGPDDLAALAQIYRDPRFETFRVFFVRENEDGTEEVVHQQGVSSRLPGHTTPFVVEVDGTAYLPEDVEEDNLSQWQQMSYWMAHQMDKNGADGYYLLHNHPSGTTDPSNGDKGVTGAAALEQGGFRGHVIIDSGEYTVLDVETPEIDTDLSDARAEYRDATQRERNPIRRKRRRKEIIAGLDIIDRKKQITDPEVLRRGQIETVNREITDTMLPEGVATEDIQGTERSRQVDRLRQPSLDHPALGQRFAAA